MVYPGSVLHIALVLAWCVRASLGAEPDQGVGAGPPSSPAADISKDIAELSHEVDEVVEDDESKNKSLDPEGAHAKQQEAFEDMYKEALDQGLEDGKAAYKSYEHQAVEELDLVGLASEHLKRFWYTGQCRRQYALQCPNGWTWNDYSKQCIAPQDYSGPCDTSKDFSNMDRNAREEYAWRCHVSWPCVNDLPIDTETLCPLEWIKVSNAICLAPPGYDGICSPMSDFSYMSTLDKAVYEHMCDVKWPRIGGDNYTTSKWSADASSALNGTKGLSGAINEAGIMVPM